MDGRRFDALTNQLGRGTTRRSFARRAFLFGRCQRTVTAGTSSRRVADESQHARACIFRAINNENQSRRAGVHPENETRKRAAGCARNSLPPECTGVWQNKANRKSRGRRRGSISGPVASGRPARN